MVIPLFIHNNIPFLSDAAEEELKIPLLEGIANYFTSAKFLRTIIVIAIAVAVWVILRMIRNKRVARLYKGSIIERNAHFILTCARVILVFFTLIIVLQVNGVNVTTLVAGLGIVSIIIGFAFQDLLSDWINGITIVAERFFNVGDVITVGDLTGRVVKINLKITQIEDILTGSVITMDNRLISQAILVAPLLNLYVPIPYEKTSAEINDFLDTVMEGIKQIDGVKRCENRGLNSFDDSKMIYLLKVSIDDAFKMRIIMRAANGVVLVKYEEKGWKIPYNQLDVHIKDK